MTRTDTTTPSSVPGQVRGFSRASRPFGKTPSDAALLSAQHKANKPLVLGSSLGVLLCSLGASEAADLFDDKSPVLVAAVPIAAGQTITQDMLRAIPVAADPGVSAIPASRVSSVIGRSAATPLMPGALLGAEDVGARSYPPTGEAEIAVSLKQGAFPLDLAQGDRVQVVLASDTPMTASAGGAPSAATQAQQPTIATVTKVGKVDSQGAVVADLLLEQSTATKVAAAGPSAVSLAILGPDGAR